MRIRCWERRHLRCGSIQPVAGQQGNVQRPRFGSIQLPTKNANLNGEWPLENPWTQEDWHQKGLWRTPPFPRPQESHTLRLCLSVNYSVHHRPPGSCMSLEEHDALHPPTGEFFLGSTSLALKLAFTSPGQASLLPLTDFPDYPSLNGRWRGTPPNRPLRLGPPTSWALSHRCLKPHWPGIRLVWTSLKTDPPKRCKKINTGFSHSNHLLPSSYVLRVLPVRLTARHRHFGTDRRSRLEWRSSRSSSRASDHNGPESQSGASPFCFCSQFGDHFVLYICFCCSWLWVLRSTSKKSLYKIVSNGFYWSFKICWRA